MDESEVVCSWQVFHKDVKVYEIIKTEENNFLLTVVEFEILCLFVSF